MLSNVFMCDCEYDLMNNKSPLIRGKEGRQFLVRNKWGNDAEPLISGGLIEISFRIAHDRTCVVRVYAVCGCM